MKKLTLIISALALVLGLSQCTKPNMSDALPKIMDNFPEEITFSLGGGAKGDFNGLFNGDLPYVWKTGDCIYVYSGKDVEGKFVGTKLLGKISLLDFTDAYHHKATFKGVLDEKPDETDNMLRFAHYGDGLNVSAGGEVTADFSTQTCKLNGDGDNNDVSSKVVAFCDKTINLDGKYTECTMEVQFALLKFKLTDFTTDDGIKVYNVKNTGFNVTTKGDIEMINDNHIITLPEIAAENNWLVLMPSENAVTHTFTDMTIQADVTKDFAKNMVYRKGTSDDYEIVAQTKYSTPSLFSVSSTKQVHFAKANLYWDGTAYKLENSQLDFYNTYVATHVSHFYFMPTDNGIEKPYGNQVYKHGGNPDLTGDDGDVLFTNADATSPKPNFTVNNITGKYRTLSSSPTSESDQGEWAYLIQYRTDASNKWGAATITKSDGTTTVFGVVILPDLWKTPSGCTFNVGKDAGNWEKNVYSYEQWTEMEKAGALFLPHTRMRVYGTVMNDDMVCAYSSGTSIAGENNTASCACVDSGTTLCVRAGVRRDAKSIRLVSDITPNPSN